uniref:Putative leucine-rich repeat receptor-like protein kinase At2g19210 n=1 Tax=Tanacetum cinerariifolium TaxID=118510 RepID=A0A6L2KW27_TANCI|nr:putative leucine-rich repeat receptor-like protein kinase At2g19210 [Tanacetum cinerariifolium]
MVNEDNRPISFQFSLTLEACRHLKRTRASREMKVFQDFLPVLVLGLLFTSILVLAQDDQSGFISIDCGIVEGSTYTDNATGINYVSGANFIDSGRGTPFISAIELRPLGNYMYEETTFGSLHLYTRLSFTNQSATIRYNSDKYDRLWDPLCLSNTTCLSTSDKIYPDTYLDLDPPSEVMTSAISPIYPSHQLELSWPPVNATDKNFLYAYFAEIENLKSNQTREFEIYLNGKSWNQPTDLSDYPTLSVNSGEPEMVAPNYTLRITGTENSTLPPIINALEVYTLKQIPQRQTDDRDAAAMWSIKSSYRIATHWQGDPCAPQEFTWEGVRCSYNNTESPRIIFLNLSASGLNGEINPGLANLTKINTLDLSNNNLTGKVPKFLAELRFLKEFKRKPFHWSTSSRAPRKVKQGIIVIETSLSNERLHAGKTRLGTELEMRKQQYTYSAVQSMTENFKVVLGEGGFGTVYHGRVHDTQVAVKILSKLSHQGDKEFQAEAMLLLSIHHKSITSLVGYCNEADHKGIIYEYMANGNLEMHLFGLEYLHHGCKPPIIHRDVKCNNILLTESFQAKLADFGLSRAFSVDGGTHVSTVVAGTPGYLDPEYYTSTKLTTYSDIYSFGVVLLVLITGQPAITKYENENIHIVRWVNLMLKDGNVKKIVDPRLLGDYNINSAWKAVEVAIACVDQTPSKRPNMVEVVMTLSECLGIERASQETNTKDLNGVISFDLEGSHDGPNPR